MEVERVAEEAREAFESGGTKSYFWRRSQLMALKDLVNEMENAIYEALELDLGKHRVEAYRDEAGLLVKSVDYALKNLKKWMSPQKVNVPLICFPATAEVVPEPLGVVLIFASWNFPIGLSLEPLIGAISAGNSVVLKPSELAPASSKFLATNLPKYLDNKAVKVIEGGIVIGQQLLEQKWDKIFFTGSTRVGRIIMAAAAKHLTPVCLELGGKCPAIVDSFPRSRDLKYAVDSLPFGGTGQSGFGKYHGKFSFDMFSHGKAVLRRSFLIEISFIYPPWSERKLQFIRYLNRFNYIGMLLILLGLKKCSSP